jgi:hypothetical protein
MANRRRSVGGPHRVATAGEVRMAQGVPPKVKKTRRSSLALRLRASAVSFYAE